MSLLNVTDRVKNLIDRALNLIVVTLNVISGVKTKGDRVLNLIVVALNVISGVGNDFTVHCN